MSDGYTKDPIIGFRSYMKRLTEKKDELNPNGWESHILYMDQDQAVKLLEVLTTKQENVAGVKFNIQVKKKARNDNPNITFNKAYMFVGSVIPKEGKDYKAAQGRFVPKKGTGSTVAEETESKIKELKKKGIA